MRNAIRSKEGVAHCPVTVVQRYRDSWGMQPLNLPSLYPPSFRFLYLFYRSLAVPNAPKNRFVYKCNYRFLLHKMLIHPSLVLVFLFVLQHAGIELGPHRYDCYATNLYAMLHPPVVNRCYTKVYPMPGKTPSSTTGSG